MATATTASPAFHEPELLGQTVVIIIIPVPAAAQ